MPHPAKTYEKNALEIGSPRELEAQLLMRAASQLQAVKDGAVTKMADVLSAVRYNRILWVLFAFSTSNPDNPLPIEIRKNVINLAAFVVNRSITLETAEEPEPDRVEVLININREIAAGLRTNAA
jgi:flagellar biosynthesis activator protein FlaF